MGLLTAAAALEALVPAAGIQKPSTIGPGVAHYVRDDRLDRRLVISKGKHRPGRLYWWVEIADEVFDPMLKKGWGGLHIDVLTIDAAEGRHDEGFGWPTTASLDPRLIDDLTTHAPQALNFVTDRHEFAERLLEDRQVVRDGVCAEFRGTARRLVEALIVARDLGDAGLERRVLGVLGQRGPEVDPNYIGETYRDVAAFWAVAFGRLVTTPLTDIAGTRGNRPLRVKG